MGRNWKRAQPQGPAPRQFLTRQLFFKWIKQHLRIKQFYGTSDNAVKTQIWIAVSVYVLIAIVKKRLALEASLYTCLLYTSDAADDLLCVDLGGRRIIQKKK